MTECRICKFPVQSHDGGEFTSCSDFCATTSEREKMDFLTLQPGEYGVWPCSEGGCATEGEYKPGAFCSSCAPKRDARVRGELLQRMLKMQLTLDPDFVNEVREALGIKE